jgi:hypothetical protein
LVTKIDRNNNFVRSGTHSLLIAKLFYAGF